MATHMLLTRQRRRNVH